MSELIRPKTAEPDARSSMKAGTIRRIEAAIHDAVFDPEHWQVALQLVADATDAAGAVLIVRDNRTNSVQWVSIVGVGALLAANYVDHYSRLDRYSLVLERSSLNQLVRLSETIAPSDLQRDEWYNDFVLKCGIGDVVASRVHDSNSNMVLLGIHEGIGRPPLAPENAAILSELLEPVGRAVWLQQRLHDFGWRSSVALRSLDHLAAGVIVSDEMGRVIEINTIAEGILRQGDGLTLRQGKLCAGRAFESGKLAALLAGATAATDTRKIGRMVIGRADNKTPYLLTVAPLDADLALHGRSLALMLIIDPDSRRPTPSHLTELFGLSPAEGRIAVGLMSGKIIREIAIDLGVEIATLRTQLSSVFRKVGVKRQADLMRILASIPVERGDAGDALRDGPQPQRPLGPRSHRLH